ncbi:hypothetical protein [Spiroplasma ixodetis]|uniref:hypothetical protein n=1 Tax=Spiroplasma ixodetis TaxID=2141 RepID=UPI002574C399|nr:hypothetical protein [Spiroplasma ixodetis]
MALIITWILISAFFIWFLFFCVIIKDFLPLCTIFKFYHINAEKSLSTDFSPHF